MRAAPVTGPQARARSRRCASRETRCSPMPPASLRLSLPTADERGDRSVGRATGPRSAASSSCSQPGRGPRSRPPCPPGGGLPSASATSGTPSSVTIVLTRGRKWPTTDAEQSHWRVRLHNDGKLAGAGDGGEHEGAALVLDGEELHVVASLAKRAFGQQHREVLVM